MRRFRFRLEALMRLRKQAGEQAREHYAAMLVARENREAELAVATRESRQLNDALQSSRNQVGWASRQPSFQAAYSDSLHRLAASTERLRSAQADEEQARLAWLEARQEVEIMERLEEKARQAHTVEERRNEELELEAMALARWSQPRPQPL